MGICADKTRWQGTRHWAYTVPTLHATRISCPSATCPFVVLVSLDPTEEEPCGTC
jgi:hypothetical protein